jgi:hypothetical protein
MHESSLPRGWVWRDLGELVTMQGSQAREI